MPKRFSTALLLSAGGNLNFPHGGHGCVFGLNLMPRKSGLIGSGCSPFFALSLCIARHAVPASSYWCPPWSRQKRHCLHLWSVLWIGRGTYLVQQWLFVLLHCKRTKIQSNSTARKLSSLSLRCILHPWREDCKELAMRTSIRVSSPPLFLVFRSLMGVSTGTGAWQFCHVCPLMLCIADIHTWNIRLAGGSSLNISERPNFIAPGMTHSRLYFHNISHQAIGKSMPIWNTHRSHSAAQKH